MWTSCTNCHGPFRVPTADEAHAPVRLCAACKFDERARVADPAYTPTTAEALRNPAEFVDGMTEVTPARIPPLTPDEALSEIAVGLQFFIERHGDREGILCNLLRLAHGQ